MTPKAVCRDRCPIGETEAGLAIRNYAVEWQAFGRGKGWELTVSKGLRPSFLKGRDGGKIERGEWKE